MREGDVVLMPIQQADGITKNRPAVLLREMPPFRDFLVCGVSTQLHQRVKDFDELVSTSDSDFSLSGLKNESLIRLGFLAVMPRSAVLGSIGSITPDRHRRLLKSLVDYLIKA